MILSVCLYRCSELVFSLKEAYRNEYFNQITKRYIPVEFWIYSCWIYGFVDWLQYPLVFNNDTGIRHLKVKEEHRPRVFKNWVLREIIETKLGESTENCRKFNSVALRDLLVLNSKCYYVMRSMGMRRVGHVLSMAVVLLIPHKLLASSMLLLQTAGQDKKCSFWLVAIGMKSVVNLWKSIELLW
jgi:hypothetical protein